MDEVPNTIRIELFKQRRQLWANSAVQFQLDARVAKALNDADMAKVAADNLKRTLMALDEIDRALAELTGAQ